MRLFCIAQRNTEVYNNNQKEGGTMATAKTSNVNVRIQENIKKQAEEILETIGLSRATAIDLFYRQIIINNGIPFPLTIPKSPVAIENVDKETFEKMLLRGYSQAIEGKSRDMNIVFDELERSL